MNRRDSRGDSSSVPELNSIFQGLVVSVKDYGAFIKIPGYVKNGLVHISQMSTCRVEDVNEIVNINDKVWCKVISLGEDSNKISLSMKVVNQGSGKDLDPNGVQTMLDDNKRKTHQTFSQPKITLDAVFNAVCKKCGTKGHLAQNCFRAADGKSYDLVEDEDDDNNEDDREQDVDHKHRASKKKQKSKKRKRHDSSGSNGSSASRSDDRRERPHHKSHKKKKHRHHSASPSTSRSEKRQ